LSVVIVIFVMVPAAAALRSRQRTHV